VSDTPRTNAAATRTWDEVLRSGIVVHVDFARELEREIARLTAERDEARQMYCNAMTDHCEEHEARQIAREQGWDCFKEDGK
jgi:hypothetical protein